jgi:hypothetical protein
LPRCWCSQYDPSPETIRSCHHVVARISRRQDHEVFQSSRMSWSSKIIADGTVDSTQRITSSLHASR